MTASVAIFFVLAADPAAKQAPWEEAAKDNGITIYTREVSGSEVREMKAIGTIDAKPQEVWKAIRDYPNYTKTMPYTSEAKILGREDGDKVLYLYSRLALPLVDNRDYVIKLTDDSDWKEGAGYLKVSWTNFDAPKGDPKFVDPVSGVVRVPVNDGFWKLEPRENGNKTWATYYVHTDPGGSVPKWIANKANSTAVPNVFAAIRKVVADDRAKATEKK
ncbi:MAG: hypothetical protein IPJ65_16950 [Archangiaceae bacterium]|nr:hypothetical protein [Archangiaceae bacterium]